MPHNIDISISLRSPFLTGNAAAGEMAIDNRMLRNNDNHLMFPGSLMRGILRDALFSMNKRASNGLCGFGADKTQNLFKLIFGSESSAEIGHKDASNDDLKTAFEPKSAVMHFGDLLSKDTYEPSIDSYKVRIERDSLSGANVEGSLQQTEMIGEHGAIVDFSMSLEYLGRQPNVDTGEFLKDVKKLIDLAFRAITSIGASKSAGYGRIAGTPVVKINDLKETKPCDIQLSFDGQNFASLYLELEGPLLINTQRVGTNAFISDAIIPGAAIKAAFSERLNSEYDEQLSNTRITHAMPVLSDQKDAQCQILPLSVGLYDGDGIKAVVDLAAREDICLVKGVDSFLAPTLETDWKDLQAEFVNREFEELLNAQSYTAPVARLKRETVVRTKIDYNHGAAAFSADDGGQLFVQELVQPFAELDGDRKKVVWRFDVRCEDASFLSTLVSKIEKSGIRLGKNKTHANLGICKHFEISASSPWYKKSGRSFYSIILQTSAVMFEAETCKNEMMDDLYKTYFQGISGVDIRVERLFAKQELRGGYQALRYQGGRKHYMPWMLTTPGSTFVVSCSDDDATAFEKSLQDWQKDGLPVSLHVKQQSWEDCPFVPQNGYGQIALNPIAYGSLNGAGKVSFLKIGLDEDAA